MANQSNLTPKEQQALFDLLKKAGQQPTTNMGEAVSPDSPEAQQGISTLFEQQNAPELAPGTFKDNPQAAIDHIAQKQTFNPQLTYNARTGALQRQIPNPVPWLRPFKPTWNVAMDDPTNYAPLAQKLFGDSMPLPENLPKDPNGNVFMDADQFKTLAASRVLSTASNNPPVTLRDALILKEITPDQYQQLKTRGMQDDTTKPLNEWRLGVLGRTAATREGQLVVARNKMEAQFNNDMLKEINAAHASQGSQLGIAENIVNQAHAIRQGIATRYDPNTDQYDMGQAEVGDLLLGTARMLTRKGQITNEQLDTIKQDTLAGRINNVAQFLFGRNFRGNTQDIIRRALQIVDKEGLAHESLRNMYLEQGIQKGAPLKQLNPALYNQNLEKAYGGINFSQLLADSPDTKSPNYLTPTITPIVRSQAPQEAYSPNASRPNPSPVVPTQTPSPALSVPKPGQNPDTLIMNYLAGIKAKDTPANRAWAKKKLGL